MLSIYDLDIANVGHEILRSFNDTARLFEWKFIITLMSMRVLIHRVIHGMSIHSPSIEARRLNRPDVSFI